MSKNTQVYVFLIVLVGILVWFFVKKAMNVSNNSELNNLVKDEAVKSDNNDVWTKFDNGLEIQDVVLGNGEEAKRGDAIAAHYVGTLSNGQKFDSSYDRGEPFSFVLGSGSVIKGWDLGLVGMRVGGKRKLIIPPDLGYGSRGAGGGIIPPDAILFFEIELMDVQIPQKK